MFCCKEESETSLHLFFQLYYCTNILDPHFIVYFYDMFYTFVSVTPKILFMECDTGLLKMHGIIKILN